MANLIKGIAHALLVSSIFILPSCEHQEVLKETNTGNQDNSDRSAKLGVPTTFSQAEFAIRIETYMKDKVAGFGYSIINDGKEYYNYVGGKGWARKPFEANPTLHGAKAKQEILGTTQYVTAIAVLRVLRKYDLSLSTPVYHYLPDGWIPSSNFKALTFERLLAHRTGLVQYTPVTDLQNTVEQTVNTPVFTNNSYEYADVNYKMLALILPFVHAKELVTRGDDHLYKIFKSLKNNNDIYAQASTVYREFVRANVFAPAGLENSNLIDWRAWDQNGWLHPEKATKGYPTKSGMEKGLLKEDNILFESGTTGLYLSASEFARLQYAVNTFKVIDEVTVNEMKTKLLGFDGKLVGTKGTYYWKKGDGKNCEAMIIDFGKVQVAVFANSPESDISNPAVVANMFESSLHAQPITL